MEVVFLRQVYQNHEESAWLTETTSSAHPLKAIDTSVQDLVMSFAMVSGSSSINIHNGEVF
jgi:hypothetical protein